MLVIVPKSGNFSNILSICVFIPPNPSLLTIASSPSWICGTKSLANIKASIPIDIGGPAALPKAPDKSSIPEAPSSNPPMESPLANLS